jgi:hypothetical protein
MNPLLQSNQQTNEDNFSSTDKHFETHSSASISHTGTQMSQLIANSRPLMLAQSKILLKKLTANANKMLFPIREQKLLMKRPGKEG